jgi:hypothetical protein
VECSLGPRVVITKAVDEASNRRAGLTESSSESSESDGILYHVSSSSLVCSLSEESGGEESSDWLSDKSGKSYRPPKVAIIAKVKRKV